MKQPTLSYQNNLNFFMVLKAYLRRLICGEVDCMYTTMTLKRKRNTLPNLLNSQLNTLKKSPVTSLGLFMCSVHTKSALQSSAHLTQLHAKKIPLHNIVWTSTNDVILDSLFPNSHG